MATVFDRAGYPPRGGNRNGRFTLSGTVVLGVSGAISSSDTPFFKVLKTAGETGRYDVSLINAAGETGVTAKALLSCTVRILTASADAAYGATKAAAVILRNNNINTTGAFQVQGILPATNADAEFEDSVTLFIEFDIKNSSATP